MTTHLQLDQARPRLAFMLRSIVRKIHREDIGAGRWSNLTNELHDYLHACSISSRTTMAFFTMLAERFGVNLSDDGQGRPLVAFIPESLAGDLPGLTHEGQRVVSWSMLAQHTPLDAVRILLNEHDGPAFYVTFSQLRPGPDDTQFFLVPETQDVEPWSGILPGGNIQSPKQHRSWFTLVSPLAHGSDDKRRGNVQTFRRQREIDPFLGEVVLVPIYTGNAIKGAWRDAFMARMLRAVGVLPEKDLNPRRSQELFSGGTIEKGADGAVAKLDVRRRARTTIPAIDLLGGCIEQQIMSGLLRVHDCTLLCQETAWKLYRMVAPTNHAGFPLSYEDFRANLRRADDLTMLRLGVRQAHRDFPGGDLSADQGGAQMFWNTEVLLPGAQLFHSFSLVSLSTVSSLAKSCLADLLQDFTDTGLLGAQTARGPGQFTTQGYVPAEKADPLPSPDEYLSYLHTNADQIREWLAGPVAVEKEEKKSEKKRGRTKLPAAGFGEFDPEGLPS